MDSTIDFEKTCVFCQIVAGEGEASIVYRDDLVTAFMDLFPVGPGHTLVIPNQHAALIHAVKPETVGRIFQVGARINRAIRESDLRCEAVSLYLADGAAAGQVVHHSHLHVVPRFPGDSCGLRLHSGPIEMALRKNLDEHAKQIRTSMEGQH
jgi:histidine triad (HIT) family protein